MNRKSFIGWITYDFANTIFSAVVLTAYFPLYLTELAGTNWYLGAATTGSMILAGAFTPFLGALSDHTGKTKLYLIRTTLAAIFLLSLFSLIQKPEPLIFVFLLACFFFHASLVFYNSLLPVAVPPSKQGFASGVGTGLGYLGVVCTLPIAHIVDQQFGRPVVFSVAAMLFLLFAVPLFLFVPERKVPSPIPFQWHLWRTEWGKILKTLKALPTNPVLLLFLGGNFFVVDALNSTIFWFLVYAREVFEPGQQTLIILLMSVNAAAFLSGILAGIMTDRWGAMNVMILASATLALSLCVLAVAPNFLVFAAVCCVGGAFAIAGIWTAGRKVLIELADKEKLGEYFGLYGLTTKISVIGSLIFSIVADFVGFRAALWILVFPATVGFLFLLFSKLVLIKK